MAESKPAAKLVRKECVYGEKCYRKNPMHFEEFSHKHLELMLKNGVKVKPEETVIIEQLQIVKYLKFSSQSTTSDESSPAKKAKFEKDKQNRADQKVNDENVKEAASSSRNNDYAEMIREATKHHGDVQAKLDAAAPYYFFLTSISKSPQTHNEPLTITFTELMDKSLGELECSLQINFMVDLGWLLAQYFYTGNRFKPLTLLYGVGDEDLDERNFSSNITAVHVKTGAFGHHHTKMSILAYTDKSIRIIVSTANLVESDWENRTQGLWVSPKLPELPPGSDTRAGESPTKFKEDLLRYFSAYRLPQLQEWEGRVRRVDFSAIRVFLIASAPGVHRGPDVHFWGHKKLYSILKNHVQQSADSQRPWAQWPLIGQFSSIGTLGKDVNTWVCGELRNSMSAPGAPLSPPPVKLIYPSFNNVKDSYDGLLGGACLPYQKKTHDTQPWLESLLYQWKSNGRFRSHAVPHIKSYARVSPCNSLLSWFLLTSANLSKAAWGAETVAGLTGRGFRILSYEAGVLFLPKFIVQDFAFNLEVDNPPIESTEGTKERNDYPPFPLHYDLPLRKYSPNDIPWFADNLNLKKKDVQNV